MVRKNIRISDNISQRTWLVRKKALISDKIRYHGTIKSHQRAHNQERREQDIHCLWFCRLEQRYACYKGAVKAEGRTVPYQAFTRHIPVSEQEQVWNLQAEHWSDSQCNSWKGSCKDNTFWPHCPEWTGFVNTGANECSVHNQWNTENHKTRQPLNHIQERDTKILCLSKPRFHDGRYRPQGNRRW